MAQQQSVVKQLNARFTAGRASNDLQHCGLLVHQFDALDDQDPEGAPWLPQRPTISAALVNAAMQPEPDRGNVPVYSYSLAGLILSTRHNEVRCSYAFDTGSTKWYGACNNWRCSDTEDVDVHANGGCAFNPSGLERMLEVQGELRRRGWKPAYKVWDDHKFYNEVIIDDDAC